MQLERPERWSVPGSGASSATGAPSTAASALPSATGTSSAQTDTEWGRIWDSLPADFPTYPGATPAEETATGPASADLVVTGGDARTIATTMQAALTAAGYATAGLSGPLEDGSFTLDVTGPPPAARSTPGHPDRRPHEPQVPVRRCLPARLIDRFLPSRIEGGASAQRGRTTARLSCTNRAVIRFA